MLLFTVMPVTLHSMSSPLFTLAFLDVGGGEMMLIFFIVLLLFGGKKMPEFARGLGKSIREFKKATAGVEDEIKRVLEEPPAESKPAPKTPLYTTPPAVIEPLATIDSLETPVAPPVLPPAAKSDTEGTLPPAPEKPAA